jgi:hypothetical protein
MFEMRSSFLAVLTCLTLLSGVACRDRGASEFDLRAEYSKVRAAREVVEAAHARLDEAKARPTPAPGRPLTGATTDITELQADYNRAYEADQQVLAAFLSFAINRYPRAAETRAAVRLYVEDALQNARFVLEYRGVYQQASELLLAAESLCHATGTPPPAELTRLLGELARRANETRSTPPVDPRTAAGIRRTDPD